MEILDSARKHGIPDEDIYHAVDHFIISHSMDGYAMIVGPTHSGHLIEVGINRFDQAFHAMTARPRFLP